MPNFKYEKKRVAPTVETMLTSDPLLTVKELASMFQTTGAEVREWINEGKLKAIKPGHQYLVRTSDASALAKELYGGADQK